MNLNETEKAYLENEDTSIDNAMIFRELKKLQESLAEVKDNTSSQLTKEDILSIKDTSKRLKAINDNLELFKDNLRGGRQ